MLDRELKFYGVDVVVLEQFAVDGDIEALLKRDGKLTMTLTLQSRASWDAEHKDP